MGIYTNFNTNDQSYEAFISSQRSARRGVTCMIFAGLLLLAAILSFISSHMLWPTLRATAPTYPDLYEASIQELQSGLDKNWFTSVDLVKASSRVLESDL